MSSALKLDPLLLNALVNGTKSGLEMCGVNPPPVGATRFFSATRPIAVLVGLIGKANGTITVNMTERGMLHLAGALLCEEQTAANETVFDGIMEIGNMIAGGVKESLADSEYAISNITVPSLVLGASYDVYYTRAINIVSVEFEIEEIPIEFHKERFFSTTISMMQN